MDCLNYFYSLLARKDYSVSQLRKKGLALGFELDKILEAIDELQNRGHQSDSRLVASLIASYQGKYGKAVIKRKCQEKGIASDLFEQVWLEAVPETDSEESEGLTALKAKVMRKYKIETWRRLDPKIKGKVVNYLQYRGFNAFEILQQWQREEAES